MTQKQAEKPLKQGKVPDSLTSRGLGLCGAGGGTRTPQYASGWPYFTWYLRPWAISVGIILQ